MKITYVPTNFYESLDFSFDRLKELSKSEFESFVFDTDFDINPKGSLVKPKNVTKSELKHYLTTCDNYNPFNVNFWGQRLIELFEHHYKKLVYLSDILSTLPKPISFVGLTKDKIVDILIQIIQDYLVKNNGQHVIILPVYFDYFGLYLLTQNGEFRGLGLDDDGHTLWDEDITSDGLEWEILPRYEKKFGKLPSSTDDLKLVPDLLK